MALQDLTPQLRTRLSRMERAVGWFVFVATALLLFGFRLLHLPHGRAQGLVQDQGAVFYLRPKFGRPEAWVMTV
jgi:hypothetical protein